LVSFVLVFLFFFYCSGSPRVLHSFPTRRSSDLRAFLKLDEPVASRAGAGFIREGVVEHLRSGEPGADRRETFRHQEEKAAGCARSEEHTSELQSRGHLVCRLLLEKKKEQKHKTR